MLLAPFDAHVNMSLGLAAQEVVTFANFKASHLLNAYYDAKQNSNERSEHKQEAN